MIRILIILLLIPFSTLALTAEERLADPEKERQAHRIFKKVRCVVCSGESINDSKADIAKSLRVLIREKLSQGLDEKQILNDITHSYGDSVLMKPPVNKQNFILWLAPLIILLIGAVLLVVFFRQKPDK
ncbi:MAG: cytochrome c-type biogenesis protein CcmH [Rickettsiales bacterium]|nr:cytochrome c-type biogenesis protein CcmH [Pseudomonadota bacterium]MDA0967383.1 cytochrome c-type biogenesis protein CcmH [Pseudomonadota bacterium]MDG4544406.1 cytochrome c-type biogenesis protein CcmH [Rickettsiales bacterium]MDG4546536.1 cytochrome c-type biogenesis protein CcmH [Rickettsiales bacterium]MDG4548682.1 cytochrome c-type biogenesis protein CcmH [Rickettsiales bacterium]